MATHVPVSKPVPVGAGSQGGGVGEKENVCSQSTTHIWGMAIFRSTFTMPFYIA